MAPNGGSKAGWLGIVAAISGGSLVFFGGVSLILSLLGRSISGSLVSLAIVLHGVVELKARGALLNRESPRGGLWLWRNQLLLAASISLYAVWQLLLLNDEAVARLMRRPEFQSLLELYPVEVRSQLMDWLPSMARGLYVVVIGVAWLGCGATAFYYRSKVRKAVA